MSKQQDFSKPFTLEDLEAIVKKVQKENQVSDETFEFWYKSLSPELRKQFDDAVIEKLQSGELTEKEKYWLNKSSK